MLIFLAVHELETRKRNTLQVLNLCEGINNLQKFLDGVFVERQVVLNGIPNAGKIDGEIFRNDLFANADHF